MEYQADGLIKLIKIRDIKMAEEAKKHSVDVSDIKLGSPDRRCFFEKYITPKKCDTKNFKRRNRILLAFFVFLPFWLMIPDNNTKITKNDTKTVEIKAENKKEISIPKKQTETIVKKEPEIIPIYYIQLRAVNIKENLNKDIQMIKEDGKEHKIIESATNKGKPLYRIFIGPYEGYSKAQEDLGRVNEKFKVKGLIKKL